MLSEAPVHMDEELPRAIRPILPARVTILAILVHHALREEDLDIDQVGQPAAHEAL